jgi:hypothetical protein
VGQRFHIIIYDIDLAKISPSFDDGNIREGLGGCCGHVGMIPLL